MTLGKPCIATICGCIDAETIADLRKTLDESGFDRKDTQNAVIWRGQEVCPSFGWYLVEFVEGELAKRNTRGL